LKKYLLDTDVFSMLAPSRAAPSARFADWVERMDDEGRIYLSTVTLYEIEKGIARLEHAKATAKAETLRVWLVGLVAIYRDKIIPVDANVAVIAGQLEALAQSTGYHPGMADALIAGISKAHDVIVVTRNAKDFIPFGIPFVTPDEVGG
jgi:predicted nucleic acid-binding protein